MADVVIEMDAIREHITCTLCNEIFNDAHTIIECLHTFCRSCLHDFFMKKKGGNLSYNCPRCKASLGCGSNPFKNFVRADIKKADFIQSLTRSVKNPSRKLKSQNDEVLKDGHVWNQVNDEKRLITFRLHNDDSSKTRHLKPLAKDLIQAPDVMDILHLKRYIAKKLNLEGDVSMLEVLCNKEVLGDQLNLAFVRKTRWHQKGTFCLHYRGSRSRGLAQSL